MQRLAAQTPRMRTIEDRSTLAHAVLRHQQIVHAMRRLYEAVTMRRSCAVLCCGLVLLLAATVGCDVVVAQTPSGGHEQHHPSTPPAEPTPPGAPASPDMPLPASSGAPPVSAPAGTGMGNMMQGMEE